MSQLLLAQSYQIDFSSMTKGALQSTNGNYILAGRLFNETFNSSAFALKVSPGGSLIWQKTYSSPFSEFFQAITQISDGNYVATGSFFYSNMSGDEYLWVVKINENGDKVWEKALGNMNAQNDGYDIAATADGGFVITGLILGKETGIKYTWVLKFDANGNLLWDKKFEGNIAYSITQTKDGGYILSGAHSLPKSLNQNIYVLRLDSEGDKVWDNVYTEYEIYVLLDSDIIETTRGHFVVAAKSVVMEIDSCGNIIWAHQDQAFNLNTVVETPEGNYGIGGSLIVNYFDHAYVAVIHSSGEKILWDNTEILYNSGVAQVFMNQEGFLSAGGYAPVDYNQSQSFLAVFNPAVTLE